MKVIWIGRRARDGKCRENEKYLSWEMQIKKNQNEVSHTHQSPGCLSANETKQNWLDSHFPTSPFFSD